MFPGYLSELGNVLRTAAAGNSIRPPACFGGHLHAPTHATCSHPKADPHLSPGAAMRYQVRWSNGSWKTFDTFEYRAVATHPRQVDAEASVEHANATMRR